MGATLYLERFSIFHEAFWRSFDIPPSVTVLIELLLHMKYDVTPSPRHKKQKERKMAKDNRYWLFAVVFALALTACGSNPAPEVAAVPIAPPGVAHAPAAAPASDASGLEELDRAIRDVSDYLNNTIPRGSMIVILNVESEYEALSDYIIDHLIANAVNDRIFTVVDRHQLDVIRREQDLHLSGEVDDDTALGIGHFLGAQVIVSGRVSSLGGNYRLTIRALEVQTARTVGMYNRNIGTTRTISALMGSGRGRVAQVPVPAQQVPVAPTQPAAPMAPMVAAGPVEITVPGNTLAEKWQWLQANIANNTRYHIKVTRNESIVPMTFSFPRARNVTVRLSGDGVERVISLPGSGALFSIESGVTLILDNGITLRGRDGNNAPLVRVRNRGELIMNDGAKIYGNNNTAYPDGGGVRIYGHGTFTMNGGEITGNSASGGSLHNGGGGVNVSRNGTFTMAGGMIHSNTALDSGGGVFVHENGNFTMAGGEISNNTAGSEFSGVGGNGGGVFLRYRASFTMKGGEIYGNTARGGGGGVHIWSATFTMSGGEISGNTSSYWYGGGVYVRHSRPGMPTTFTKTGGTIYGSNGSRNDNRARNGHAVYVSSWPRKFRNSTAGTEVRLDTNRDGALGGWEN